MFNIKQNIEDNILKYCKLNNIEDIDKFVNKCLLNGFNIEKYGVNPKDNIDREIGRNNSSKKTVKVITLGKKKHDNDIKEG